MPRWICYKKEIQSYYSSLEVLAKQIEELHAELKDKEYMDITALGEHIKRSRN